jgi:hypothetical protein
LMMPMILGIQRCVHSVSLSCQTLSEAPLHGPEKLNGCLGESPLIQ